MVSIRSAALGFVFGAATGWAVLGRQAHAPPVAAAPLPVSQVVVLYGPDGTASELYPAANTILLDDGTCRVFVRLPWASLPQRPPSR